MDGGPFTERGFRTGVRTPSSAASPRDAHTKRPVPRRREEGNFHVGDDVEILSTFSDGYLDWVYLDTTHGYEHTLAELAVLENKARIIAGDDWHEDPSHSHHGVCRAVREFCATNGWRLGPIDPFGQWIITP